MRIRISLDSARLFRWHLVLIEELAARGTNVFVSFVDTPEPLPTTLTALFDYDHARSQSGLDRFSTHLSAEAFKHIPRDDGAPQAITLDLSTASRVVVHPGRVLRPLYDGSYKDYALFHALLERRAPQLAVSDSIARDRIWTIGLPANAAPWRIATAFDQVTSRLVEGLLGVVAGIAAGDSPGAEPLHGRSPASNATVFSAAGAYASARAARKLGRLKDRVTKDGSKWHVAWRTLETDNPPEPGVLNLADFRTLSDDGKRYYADPFIFVEDGRRHVFVEELPEATGRGHIAHFEIDENGRAGPVRTVIEEPHHLSYPQVFARDGAIWMLPEASAAGGLDLYRATQFPLRWEKVARLIGAPLHDATFFEHQGLLWIAAASEVFQSSSWDALALYSAESLLGPWQAHPRNPVLLNARAARPAGAFWRTNEGALIRPAQDCISDYGSRLTLMRVDRLDPRGYAETLIGQIRFSPESHIVGPHTLSRGGGLELIDLYARGSALRAGYRGPNTL